MIRPLARFWGVLWLAAAAGCSAPNDTPAFNDRPVPVEEADRATIERQVAEMIGADEHPQAPFRRWPGSVRYYVHGLDSDPHLLQQLEAQIEKVARLTGVEVYRHRRLQITADAAANGQMTNAALFYTDDLKATLHTPPVRTILAAFETTPQAEYDKIMRYAKDAELPTLRRYGYKHGKIKFVFQVGKTPRTNKTTSNRKVENILLTQVMLMLLDIDPANKVRSVYQSSFEEGPKQLTSFDKLFFEAYYSDAIPEDATKQEAAQAIARWIAERARNEGVK